MNETPFLCLFQKKVDLHQLVLNALVRDCSLQLERIAEIWVESLIGGRRILFAGNGGSAAEAQHLAAELVVHFCKNRQALPGLALTTDTSVLTACSNDLGFENVFARQVEAFGQPGDVLMVISTSGRSRNIIKAAKMARLKGLKVTVFCGRRSCCLSEFADAILAAPSDKVSFIQECHMICGHILCEWVERKCCFLCP
ncbi:MAG: SIS domain-containing protein [Candidatus Xiphinematobacter sp.]|nr:MAG: SIS domain-containing protein [Candidatus Xiphinematobacter sp.]QQY10657.1 MAG: SIS domain-containing protein [Candidatus Xiphinematobacter sp.]